jgi:hypothetical protein
MRYVENQTNNCTQPTARRDPGPRLVPVLFLLYGFVPPRNERCDQVLLPLTSILEVVTSHKNRDKVIYINHIAIRTRL